MTAGTAGKQFVHGIKQQIGYFQIMLRFVFFIFLLAPLSAFAADEMSDAELYDDVFADVECQRKKFRICRVFAVSSAYAA